MYVLYSKDEQFVYNMVCKVTKEVVLIHNLAQLETLLQYPNRPILYRCLFFLLINFHTDFRYWVLSENTSKGNGLPQICPHKESRFLQHLRENLVLQFLVHEEMTMEEFNRNIKMTYVAS